MRGPIVIDANSLANEGISAWQGELRQRPDRLRLTTIAPICATVISNRRQRRISVQTCCSTTSTRSKQRRTQLTPRTSG